MSTRFFTPIYKTNNDILLADETIYEIPKQEEGCCKRNGKMLCVMLASCTIGITIGIFGNLIYMNNHVTNISNFTI